MSAGRTREDVAALLERQAIPIVVGSQQASFRPAVPRGVPKTHRVVDPFPLMPQVMKDFQNMPSHWAQTHVGGQTAFLPESEA
jgi:hypothetical protein